MRIEELWHSGQVSPFSNGVQPRQGEQEQSLLPSSWGSDKVNISPEALAAQKASEQEGQDDAGSASDSFKKYMGKARGKMGAGGGTSSSGGVEDQIKALQEKAADLSNRIASTATSTNIPQETKDSQLQTLNGELNQVMAQISQLQSQLASEEA